MLPRIKRLEMLPNFVLWVEFDDGVRVVYDVKGDIEAVADFEALRSECGLFARAQVDASRTCVFWNERVDLASDCIYEYGVRC